MRRVSACLCVFVLLIGLSWFVKCTVWPTKRQKSPFSLVERFYEGELKEDSDYLGHEELLRLANASLAAEDIVPMTEIMACPKSIEFDAAGKKWTVMYKFNGGESIGDEHTAICVVEADANLKCTFRGLSEFPGRY